MCEGVRDITLWPQGIRKYGEVAIARKALAERRAREAAKAASAP